MPGARVLGGLLVGLLLSAAPALAANIGFMDDSPFAYFSEKDLELFKAALGDILDKGTDGESRTWSNPASTAGGTMSVVKSFERDGLACRSLSITNKAKGRSEKGQYRFCRQSTGEWKVAR
jgi:surface antigen